MVFVKNVKKIQFQLQSFQIFIDVQTVDMIPNNILMDEYDICPCQNQIKNIYNSMARKFKDFVERPKPKKRPGIHKKRRNKQEKRQQKNR